MCSYQVLRILGKSTIYQNMAINQIICYSNFCCMGDNLKILFSSMGYLGTGNSMKLFWERWARFLGEFGDILLFYAVFNQFYLYLTCFSTHNQKYGISDSVLGIGNVLL